MNFYFTTLKYIWFWADLFILNNQFMFWAKCSSDNTFFFHFLGDKEKKTYKPRIVRSNISSPTHLTVAVNSAKAIAAVKCFERFQRAM